MKHIVNYQVCFDAPTQVEAEVHAESVEMVIEEALDDEDTVERSTAVVSETQLPPYELIAKCVSVRNALIATKIIQCYDVARELDRVIRLMRTHFQDADYVSDDSQTFMEIANEVLTGGNPTT